MVMFFFDSGITSLKRITKPYKYSSLGLSFNDFVVNFNHVSLQKTARVFSLLLKELQTQQSDIIQALRIFHTTFSSIHDFALAFIDGIIANLNFRILLLFIWMYF